MDASLTIEELIQELDEPDLTDWKLFAQCSGVNVYRRIDDNNKLLRYKCHSHIPDVTPEVFYKVALDIEYRVAWDRYLKEAKEINDGEKHGVYWQVIMPLFIDNRDYTCVRDFGEYDIGDRHFYYVMTRSEYFNNFPPREKIVRIETCQSQILLCSDAVFIYNEDPSGNIPKAVWTWAAKFGVPLYAKLTHDACLAYPKWIKNKQKKLSEAAASTIFDVNGNLPEQEKE